MPTSLQSAIPAELVAAVPEPQQALQDPSQSLAGASPIGLPPMMSAPAQPDPARQDLDHRTAAFIVGMRNKLRTARRSKVDVWNECWQLYRGQDNFDDKEDWQSQIVLPKAWNSVKMATNTIKRLLSAAKSPWSIEATNPDDLVTVVRGGQMTDLSQVLMEQAKWLEEFSEGLECGFIMGLGLWKVWWALVPRLRTEVVQAPGPNGQPQRQVIQKEVLEGRLMIRAVDPYNFYWLPGSKINRWSGTIEEIEIPRWELVELAEQGVFDPKRVKAIRPMKIDAGQRQGILRFNEPEQPTDNEDMGTVKLTEYYGPLVLDGKIIERYAHVLIANDSEVLVNGDNKFWHKKCPYIGFSPLSLPFRTEGVGLVEMVRKIDKALNQLANLSVDTLMFRLLPIFEVNIEAYENPEDLETALTPGKLLRRNQLMPGQAGMVPVEFQDISQGAVQVAASLDRSHQEGALVSEIQQALPRYRGYQSAAEITAKDENQDSFFGSMATDIEKQALEPLVEMAMDLVLQFIDTANDPRIPSILGVGADTFKGLSKEELMEMVQGDYKIKVSGLSGQLQKVEMLQNLVQFMNLIGQNAEEWTPYLNKDALLRRILEAFRPAIRDIEQIIADPSTVEAAKAAASTEALTPDMIAMIPQLVQMAQAQQQQQQEMALQQQQIQQAIQQSQVQAAAQQQEWKREDEVREQEHQNALELARVKAKPKAEE